MSAERRSDRFVVLLSGRHDPSRGARAERDEISRNELTEFERRLDAEIVDFSIYDDGGAFARLVGRLGRAVGRLGEVLPVAAWGRTRGAATVYATGEDAGFVVAAMMLLAPWRRTRLIVRVENPIYGDTRIKRAVYGALAWLAVRRIDAVLCRSAIHADELRRRSPHPDRVRTINQEIDLRFHRPVGADEPTATLPEGLPDRFVLSAGLEQRDYATLFAAVDGLDAEVVIGASSPWSKDVFEADEPPANVTIRKFDVGQMRELYRRAAVVAVTVKPTTRTCGISVVAEAWANGRPVVAAVRGIHDCVRDAGSVALRPGDVDGVRQGIAELLADPDRADAMGAAGRRYTEEHLSLDRFVDVVEALHREGRS